MTHYSGFKERLADMPNYIARRIKIDASSDNSGIVHSLLSCSIWPSTSPGARTPTGTNSDANRLEIPI